MHESSSLSSSTKVFMAARFESSASEIVDARVVLLEAFREEFFDFFRDEAVAKTLGQIESGEIGREGLKSFFIQQIVATRSFLGLLEILVAQKQCLELQAAAASNLRDETGMDIEGNYHVELAHSTWRKNFYQHIGIAEDEIDCAVPTPGTTAYFDAIAEIVSEGDIGKVAGALLFFEGVIPRQFNSFKKGRDTLFREECVDTDGDDAVQREAKQKARLYLDDHIVHDAQCHFPDLLNALAIATQSSKEMAEKVKLGITLAKDARKKFYQGQDVIDGAKI